MCQSHQAIKLTGLIARRSTEFVESVFQLYNSRLPFVSSYSPASLAKLPGIELNEIIDPGEGTGWLDHKHPILTGPEIAQVNFTSGTTGASKGILLSYDALADTTERLIEAQQLDSSVREYVGVPPNYSFGLGRHRAIAAVGGKSFLSTKGFDPAEIGNMLSAGEINALSAVPTLLRVLLSSAHLIESGRGELQWLEIGSQHMTASEKGELKKLFPNARIIQHYGLTEASRSTFLDITTATEPQLASVGRPVGATTVDISSAGHIRIKGPHIAEELIGNDGREALTDNDGWLTTSDLGYVKEGFLFFEGRADDLINFGGIKLMPDTIESALRAEVPAEVRFAVARVDDLMRGNGILVATDNMKVDLDQLRDATVKVLASLNVRPGTGLHVVRVDALPVTETGKVQRNRLASMTSVAEALQVAQSAIEDGPINDVARLFRTAFPRVSVDSKDSFIGLGGDSLNYVTLSIALEDLIGELPYRWEEKTVASLEKMVSASQEKGERWWAFRGIESEVLIRAFAILAVVAHHGSDWAVEGGANILLMLFGYNLSRYQANRLSSGHGIELFLSFTKRIIVPYYIYLFLYLIVKSEFDIPSLLLISNYSGRFHSLLEPYWFLEMLFQVNLIIIIVFAFPLVRAACKENPWEFGVVSVFIGLALALSSNALFPRPELVYRTPETLLWLISLGWCLHRADTMMRQIIIVGLVVGIFLVGLSSQDGLQLGYPNSSSQRFWFLGSCLLIMWIPRLRVPVVFHSMIASVAAASFYIYLTHNIPVHLLRYTLHQTNAFIVITVATMIGVLFWRLIQLVDSKRLG